MSEPLASPRPEAMSLSADGVTEEVAPDIEELGPPPRSDRNKVVRLVS